MDQLRRLLASSAGWFVFVLFEYVVLIAIFRWIWPENDPSVPAIVLIVLVVVALTVGNVWLSRRLRRDG